MDKTVYEEMSILNVYAVVKFCAGFIDMDETQYEETSILNVYAVVKFCAGNETKFCFHYAFFCVHFFSSKSTVVVRSRLSPYTLRKPRIIFFFFSEQR